MPIRVVSILAYKTFSFSKILLSCEFLVPTSLMASSAGAQSKRLNLVPVFHIQNRAIKS